MSSQAHHFDHTPVGGTGRDRLSDSALLSVLTDGACEEVLTALESGPMTVAELHAELDVPVSTLYRKVDALVEVGLLTELTRYQSDGNHKSEYAKSVAELSIDVSLVDARVAVKTVDRTDDQ
jgi:predicted transcriptional regulator